MQLKRIWSYIFREEALIIYLILYLIPVLYLCLYIHPSADDFVYGSWYKNVNHTSFFEYHRQNYLTWNGRYFSTLLLAVNPLVYKCMLGYKLIPLFLIAIFYSGLFLLLSQVFNLLTKKTIHIISLLIMLVYLNLVPSLTETIYWMSASLTYFLAWGLTFYWLYFLIIYYKNPHYTKAIFPLILMICIIGSNELSAFMTFFVLTFIAFLEIIKHKKIHNGTIIFLIFCVALICVVIIAPGNAVRQSNYPNHHNFSYALANAFINLLRICALIFKSSSFLFILLLTVLNSHVINTKIFGNEFFTKRSLCLLYLIPFIIVFFFYFVSAFSMGINPPLRVHGFIAFFVIGSVLIITIKIFSNNEYLFLEKRILKKMNVIVLSLLLFSVISDFHKKPGDNIYFKGNIMQATYDAIFTAKAYDNEMNNRYKIIEQAKKDNINDISVPELTTRSQSIFFVDIKPDSTYWVNWSTALYFDLESIKTNN